MPGRSTEITFLDSYGWDTFEATASLGYLSCSNKTKQSTVKGKKEDPIQWSVTEFSDPAGYIKIKFFDNDGEHVLTRTIFINGQDDIYYKVVPMTMTENETYEVP